MISRFNIFVKEAPASPGVYFFKDGRGKTLYVGKAANLKERLRSYFTKEITLEPAKRHMLKETKRISFQTTVSPIAALILEAQHIRTLRPKYNIALRDDKQYFYVGFSRDDFPRIFLTHQPRKSHNAVGYKALTENRYGVTALKRYSKSASADYVGPFTDGGSIKRVLKLLRRIFPYCTHVTVPRHCLYQDLGLCPINKSKIPACAEASAGRQNPPPRRGRQKLKIYKELRIEYRKSIRSLKDVLSGKRQGLIKKLKGEMARASKKEDFENAALLRDQIFGLENIFAHRETLGLDRTEHMPIREQYVKDLPENLRTLLPAHWPWRIEGYDISNIQGTLATGSMVTFVGNTQVRDWYRKFKIKTVTGANDIAMLKEVLTRRLARADWPMPDILLIDGGKAQRNAAVSALRNVKGVKSKENSHSPLPITHYPLILSLAKRHEEIYFPEAAYPVRLAKNHPLRLLFMHVRDEAHRFAHGYHETRRRKALLRPALA